MAIAHDEDKPIRATPSKHPDFSRGEGNEKDMLHILIVDDDERLLHLLCQFLRKNGFLPATSRNVGEARRLLAALRFDLLVLDIMLPGESGLVFADELRGRGSGPPILLLSAMGGIEDRISGLETGADDYLAKPFDPRELLLRIQAILRRSSGEQENTGPGKGAAAKPEQIRIGHWLVDLEAGILRGESATLALAPIERRLLECFLAEPQRIWTRDELIASCGAQGDERSIDVRIGRLRRKIERNPHQPELLLTVRGSGYRMRSTMIGKLGP